MKICRYILISILLSLFTLGLSAQVLSTSMGEDELKRRGLTQQEVQQELLNRGVDVDEVDINDPAQVILVEKEIRDVLDFLEAKKKNTSQPTDTIIPSSEVESEVLDESADPELKVDPETKKESNETPVLVFGQQLYRNSSIKAFDNLSEFRPSSGYIVGTGDKLTISIWGLTDIQYNLEVNSEGYIKPSKQPRIYISGLTLDQAKDKIRAAMKSYHTFRAQDFEVTISTARDIIVNLVGEVMQNGSFKTSAVNNAINALSLAGGPNNIGSLRNIKLVSYGKPARTVDLYNYLYDPASAENLYLTNNDYISVPPAETIVQIIGEIKRPLKYEMTASENISDLIRYAGGLTALGLKESVRVQRVIGSNLEILNVNLNTQGKSFKLQNGDIITVSKIDEKIENVVYIEGAVSNPGPYAHNEKMNVADLVNMAGLKNSAFTEVGYIKRLNVDRKTYTYDIIDLSLALGDRRDDKNYILNEGDQLIVYDQGDYNDRFEVTIEGPVRSPGSFPLDKKGELRVSDLIFMSGGLMEGVAPFGFIYRQKPNNDLNLSYIRINIEEIMKNPSSSDNVELEPNDRLILKDETFFSESSTVKIGGAVRAPGTFKYSPTLDLQDLLILAGGLKREAAPYRIDLYRLDIMDRNSTKTVVSNISIDADFMVNGGEETPLLPFDEIYVRFAPEYEAVQTVELRGEVRFPGEYALISDNPRLSTIIDQGGGLTAESFVPGSTLFRNEGNMGYIVIDLEKALKKKGSTPDVILKAGDIINIPKSNTIVSIGGATRIRDQYPDKLISNGKVNIAFEDGLRADDYIKRFAGGFASNADKRNVTVEYADGRVEKAKRRLFYTSYPKIEAGSTIQVPAEEIKPESQEESGSSADWGKVLADSVTQATAILSLLLLVRSLD